MFNFCCLANFYRKPTKFGVHGDEKLVVLDTKLSWLCIENWPNEKHWFKIVITYKTDFCRASNIHVYTYNYKEYFTYNFFYL